MTRRILPSHRLPELRSGNPILDSWVSEHLQRFVSEVFEQFRQTPSLDYSTYTPTLTNDTNVASSSASLCRWIQVGNVVHVAGRVQITPTAGATLTVLGISLPVTSDIGAISDLSGVGARQDATTNQEVTIGGDATNDRASMVFVPANNTAYDYNFVFSYTVL